MKAADNEAKVSGADAMGGDQGARIDDQRIATIIGPLLLDDS